MNFNEKFSLVAKKLSEWFGSSIAFLLAVLLVFGWIVAGPYFKWSDEHSLFINTLTTIITFLMVFIIQNTQNRETKSLQLKLDELIKSHEPASNKLLNLEDAPEEKIEEVKEEFKRHEI